MVRREEEIEWELQGAISSIPVFKITNKEFGIFTPNVCTDDRSAPIRLISRVQGNAEQNRLSIFHLLTREKLIANNSKNLRTIQRIELSNTTFIA